MTAERLRVIVVGGGIAGLTAAHRLATAGTGLDVKLLEAEPGLGGKIQTERFAGRALDVGAESLLARVPSGVELCREIGLGEELVAPASDQPFVWTDRLRPLPPRLMAGVPGGAGSLVRSGILSPAGLARAGMDLLRPSSAPAHDVSIGELVRGRLGSQALERLIDPLLGGIHAGNCDELSVRATAPQLPAALDRGHGLVRGLRALAAAAPPGAASGPVFLTLRGGLADLVGGLRAQMDGVEIRTGASVSGLERLSDGVRLTLADGESLEADEVILAVPAYVAADLLAGECPEAAVEMRSIDYASVATVALSYPAQAMAPMPDGSGFLVARGTGHTITACTWSSSKWPQLAGADLLMKCSVGHAGDRSALDLDDDALLAAVRSDLQKAMGLRGEPLEQRVFRFERALPQYAVGHLDRVARMEQALARVPGVSFTGAAFRGVGVASCIRDGRAVADRTLNTLGEARASAEAGSALISK